MPLCIPRYSNILILFIKINCSIFSAEGLSSVTSSALVGVQNESGQSVFDCVPSAGTVAPGQKVEVMVTFAPDHPGQFDDAARIVLFDQDQTHLFRLCGEAWPHIMFVTGGDRLWPDADSLAYLPPPLDEEEAEAGGKGAGAPAGSVLLTFGAKMDEEGNIEPATRHILVGCVRTMAVSQKKVRNASVESLALCSFHCQLSNATCISVTSLKA